MTDIFTLGAKIKQANAQLQLFTENFDSFWDKEIKQLFTDESLSFRVKTLNGNYVKYVNLDNGATTTPFAALKQYVDEMLDTYGSVHRGSGQKSVITTREYDASRNIIRDFVGSSPQNYVIFAKNTTEAINGAATLWAKKPGKILVSDIEHSSNLLPWITRDEVVQYKTQPDGSVSLTEIENIFKTHQNRPQAEQIKLLTITGASTITGYRPPIYELAALAHRYGAKIFADVCQLIQHERVDMRPDDDPCHLDFVAFSGHKMYAPYGTGVLLGPKEFFDSSYPYQIGGGNLPYITRNLEIKRFYTERAHDPGTPNAMGAIAIAKAIQIIEGLGRSRIAQYEHSLVEFTFTRLASTPGVKVHIAGDNLAHVIPFDIDGFDGRLVAEILAQEYGIGVRAGAFCTYEYIRKLKNISDEQDLEIANEVDKGITRNIPSIIRASFAVYNTLEDCDRFISAIAQIAKNGFDYYLPYYTQDDTTGVWTVVDR
ncbi:MULTISPECIES: aminotransferase class V-fold PLP-dependent enzyme [Nostoc]|uniref:Aminotransferase class V-fold PLP-dependent enzyme n=1 Tax=Nostoc paludosum FACHB-159 TaxID=2692908 RepID=A0ABR8K9T3_9NOSO|nr:MULTISPECIES: aminotransferase class V-fold PLP-dependent enzyme [Nostoc]MBD2680003.1 aminotransferase class V-fold PLP-dependent enzyme [Nostoc sp. FACHB-857]MBD2736258.1 aminotransferase class V-fold PLP-dependent enzyme [Nostoc paludosum FACHB-159]